ncbi:hypothetical protein BDA99DRAFT_525743 [Phascolomyces articulosus]|uniref:Uncharacterized protein n=1 Tax=Phascolomyces articulosus TaxID=60185 RepID=A0AAD5K017_9FUNG|nr:hypothetical protein BDA99DRAFT_525743 [Phascolomyces articulosus]
MLLDDLWFRKFNSKLVDTIQFLRPILPTRHGVDTRTFHATGGSTVHIIKTKVYSKRLGRRMGMNSTLSRSQAGQQSLFQLCQYKFGSTKSCFFVTKWSP